jgi:hypothetical protein
MYSEDMYSVLNIDTGNGRLHEEEGAVHCYVHQMCSVLLHYDS